MVEAGAKIKKTVEENVSNNLRESFFLFLNITFSLLYICYPYIYFERLETLMIYIIVGNR